MNETMAQMQLATNIRKRQHLKLFQTSGMIQTTSQNSYGWEYNLTLPLVGFDPMTTTPPQLNSTPP